MNQHQLKYPEGPFSENYIVSLGINGGGKVHWTVDRNWKHVIFSDEMTIVIRPDGKIKVWRKTSEKWLGRCLGYLILSLGPSYS
jgi:hypothetical protein